MRLGIETVKPDVHVKRFLRRVTEREWADENASMVLELAAKEIGRSARKLDWAIWEHEIGQN